MYRSAKKLIRRQILINNYWIKVTNELNTLFSNTGRTPKVLINKYGNLKKRCKRKCYSQEGTGSGPLKAKPVTDIGITIKGMLGAQVLSDNSEFHDHQISIWLVMWIIITLFLIAVPNITESTGMLMCNNNKVRIVLMALQPPLHSTTQLSQMSVDETTDAKGRYIANMIVGELTEEELEKTNHKTIVNLVDDSLNGPLRLIQETYEFKKSGRKNHNCRRTTCTSWRLGNESSDVLELAGKYAVKQVFTGADKSELIKYIGKSSDIHHGLTFK
ncbi:hypothetical protein FQA39_LY12063 [Lamprigera yunnana]|nr:hypothetical protein FQA39_LY12063 [Lamprigera yunnana]